MSIFDDLGVDFEAILKTAKENHPDVDFGTDEFTLIQQYSDGMTAIITVEEDDEGKRNVNIEITNNVFVLPVSGNNKTKIFKGGDN